MNYFKERAPGATVIVASADRRDVLRKADLATETRPDEYAGDAQKLSAGGPPALGRATPRAPLGYEPRPAKARRVPQARRFCGAERSKAALEIEARCPGRGPNRGDTSPAAVQLVRDARRRVLR